MDGSEEGNEEKGSVVGGLKFKKRLITDYI